MNQHYNSNASASTSDVQMYLNRYDHFDESTILKIFKNQLNLTVSNIERCPEYGSSHVVYFINTQEKNERLVFRANLGITDPEYNMDLEKFVTDELRKVGIISNQIYISDTSRNIVNYDYQIQQLIQGENLNSISSISKLEYENIWENIGRVAATTHTIATHGFGLPTLTKNKDNVVIKGKIENNFDFVTTDLSDELAYLEKVNIISNSATDKIIEIFSKNKSIISKSKGGLIHNDLADHNILYDGKHSYLIDWDNSRIADPNIELSASLTYNYKYPREKSFIKGYTQLRNLPENYEILKNIYILRTNIWKTVYASKKGHFNSFRQKRFTDSLNIFGI